MRPSSKPNKKWSK